MILTHLGRRLGAFLLLFLAALGPVAAQPAGDRRLDSETGIGALYEVLKNDYRTAGTLDRLENDAAYFATNPRARSSIPESERRKIVAMARNGEIGKLLYEAAIEDLRLRSRELSKSLKTVMRTGEIDPKAQVWDIVIIGGGIHDQIINNTLTARNGNLRVLSIESTDLVASNFALAKAIGRINSSNRATISDRLPRPGVGNLNEYPLGPLQVPDVSAVKFPTFNSLSDVATVNRAVASAEMLFNETMVSVEDRELGARGSSKWPARYRVAMASGAVVYSDALGFSAGLGDPSGAERADNVDVFTYESFATTVAESRTPFRPFVNKRVAVVGAGDSGKVAIEWLLRLAPDAGYGEDTAQVGQVGKILWLGQDKDTCFKYLNGVRSRYADIAAGIKTQKVDPYAERLDDYKKLADGTYEVTLADGEKLIVDKLIIATGFKSAVEKTLEGIVSKDRRGRKLGPSNPIVDSSAVEDVEGTIGAQEPGKTRKVVVARKLKPVGGVEQDIYFFGAGGGSIVQRDETAGITENLKSIFALGGRTAALGELLAAKFAGKRGEIEPKGRYVIKPAEGEGAKEAELKLPNLSDKGVRPLVDILLEAQLKSTLRRSFDLAPGLANLDLTFKVVDGRLIVLTSKPVLKASMDKLKGALESNTPLMQDLAALTLTGSQVKLKMVQASQEGGRVITPDRMRIQRLVSRDLTLDGDRIGLAGRIGGRVGERVENATTSGRRRER